ncbi:MAG: VOC family protein [Pseudomonadota bacterium]
MKLSLISIPVQDPLSAHDIYTNKLGFVSREFDAEAQLAIVVSSEDTSGPAMLLEPCKGSFAESYQTAAFEANLPIMFFSVQDVEAEMKKLASNGVKVRPDLDRPKWGLTNLFEDGCGNLLMLEQSKSANGKGADD